jgi:hypothetical protein
VLLVLVVAALAFSTACEDEDSAPTATSTSATTTQAQTRAHTGESPVPSASGPNENGESPVFWRTADNFTSFVESEPYLVLFRIDSGYNDESLTVTAVCTSCAAGEEQTFAGSNSPPVGEDAPGAYYPISMTFSRAGRWELTVHAGTDEVMVPVQVAEEP